MTLQVTNKMFVVAGASSLFQLVDTCIESGEVSVESINKTFDYTCDSFMFSYGDKLGNDLTKNHDWKKYIINQLKSLNSYKEKPYMQGKNRYMYVDSGGFQIQMNCLRNDEIPGFMDSFDVFLRIAKDKIQYAFSLEVAPSLQFSSKYQEVLDLNLKSYNQHAALPDEFRKKILSIYHFRTPKCLEIWRKVLIDTELYKKFTVWSIGGMAANSQNVLVDRPPLYTCAVADIIRYELNKGSKEVYIHILGTSSEFDLVLVSMMKRYAKKHHDVTLHITMDSSKCAQQVCLGRFNDIIMPNGQIDRISLFSKSMNDTDRNGVSSIDKYNDVIVPALNQYGNKFNRVEDFYYPEGHKNAGSIKHEVSLANMLYVLYYMEQLYQMIDTKVGELENCVDEADFIDQMGRIMYFKSDKSITPKGRKQILSFMNVEKVIKECDPELNSEIIKYSVPANIEIVND